MYFPGYQKKCLTKSVKSSTTYTNKLQDLTLPNEKKLFGSNLQEILSKNQKWILNNNPYKNGQSKLRAVPFSCFIEDISMQFNTVLRIYDTREKYK